MDISAFFFSVRSFLLVFDELQNLPTSSTSSTLKHNVLVILYQGALLSFWESCSTQKPTLSSIDHLPWEILTTIPWYTEIHLCFQHTRIQLLAVFLMGFTPELALTEFFIQDELGPRMTQQSNSVSFVLFHRWITQVKIKAFSNTYWWVLAFSNTYWWFLAACALTDKLTF